MIRHKSNINNNFRHDVGRGISWTGLAKISEKSIGYLRLSILARLLNPSDFGIFGFLLTMIAFLETFSEIGIAQKIIQEKKTDTKLLASAYLVQICRGFSLAILILLFGSLIAKFFNLPSLQIIYVLAVLEILKSFINPSVFLWRKNLFFGKELNFQLSSSVIELISAVFLTFWFQNYWALIGGYGIKVLYQVIYSLLLERLYLSGINKDTIFSIFKFGKWIHASSVLSFLTHEGDDLVVLKLLGANSLGLYQNAYKFSLVPVTGNIFSHFAYPLISAQPNNTKKIEKTFKLTWSVSYISYLIGGLIFLFPNQVTLILLGNNWLAMASALRVLIIYGVLRSIGGILGQYFVATGRPKINTQINLIKFLILFILIIPLIFWNGIVGASWAVVVASISANLIQLWKLRNETGFSTHCRLLIYPLASLVCGLLVSVLIQFQINSLWWSFVIGGGVFILTFGLISFYLDRFLKDLFIQIILPRLPKTIRVNFIKTQLKLKRGHWHDFNWQQKAINASNKYWQEKYDLQWTYDRHDSLLKTDIDWIIKNLKSLNAESVLEIGPGTGTLASEISSDSFVLMVMDISQVVLKNLAFSGPRIQARAEKLPFLDKSIDVIIATHLLEHVSDLKGTISEWKRVAKKGIIIIVPKESKPEVSANYHLQYFPTTDSLIQEMNIINQITTSHLNPNDHTKYIRYLGKLG